MKKFCSYLLSLLILTACAAVPNQSAEENSSFRKVPTELTGVNWKRTPNDVLRSPEKDEPLIWLGVVKDVFVSQKDGKIEIKWFCNHLVFAEPGPEAIIIRPIKARQGQGYFSLSLVIGDMTMDQAMRFKKEHIDSPHYMLAGGRFAGFVKMNEKQIPFLQTLRFGLGPDLVTLLEKK